MGVAVFCYLSSTRSNKTMAKNSANTTSPARRRPPIVVVMGHVDHGKTTLLDYIRKTNVAEREAGGITQAVGAYEITHTVKESGEERKLTFIDTPGHEAFTKMRAAGARIADIAILVIAADDGIKPQTKEALAILQETRTPFVIALNKIDRPEADIERVKTELTANNILLEGFGGSISYQPISAKTGEGVSELLDLVILAADLEELTYREDALPSGYVLEVEKTPRRGIEATVILKDGILRRGLVIATANAKGKIKILEDFQGKPAKELVPSAPARVLGFESLPQVGEVFTAAADEKTLLEAMPVPQKQITTAEQKIDRHSSEEETLVLAKAADAGSLEALTATLPHVKEGGKIHFLSRGVGEVTDGDVKMAAAAGALIVAFKSKISTPAKKLAHAQGVPILSSPIIYKLFQDLEAFLRKQKETSGIIGKLEILATFNTKKLHKQLVGGKVIEGVFKNKGMFAIQRSAEIVGTGEVLSLQHMKKEATQVEEGKEAGLLVNARTEIQQGDILILQKTS